MQATHFLTRCSSPNADSGFKLPMDSQIASAGGPQGSFEPESVAARRPSFLVAALPFHLQPVALVEEAALFTLPGRLLAMPRQDNPNPGNVSARVCGVSIPWQMAMFCKTPKHGGCAATTMTLAQESNRLHIGFGLSTLVLAA